MYLMYYTNENGDKVYTLKQEGAAMHTLACALRSVGSFANVADEKGLCDGALVHKRGLREARILVGNDGAGILGGLPPCNEERPLYSVYISKETPTETPTLSAHPARFSPDDKFSKHRIICKKRFNLLPTQQPPHSY